MLKFNSTETASKKPRSGCPQVVTSVTVLHEQLSNQSLKNLREMKTKFCDTFLSFLSLAVILINCISFISAYGPEVDSCYSFGGGNVFPEGNRRVDHKLQVTKAVSESIFNSYVRFEKFSFMIPQSNVLKFVTFAFYHQLELN